MILMKDIAKATDVSIRTVSRALNNSGYVKAEKKKRIIDYALKIGYRPNRIARSLRMQNSFEVIVVTCSIDELHMAKIAGLEQVIRNTDYFVSIIFPDKNSKKDQEKILNEILIRHPSAAAMIGFQRAQGEMWVKRLTRAGIHYVVIDTEANVDAVRINREEGVYEAVMYLAEKHKKRIAYMGPCPGDEHLKSYDLSRLRGYQKALQKLGHKPVYLTLNKGSKNEDYLRIVRKCMNNRLKPDAVLAYDDSAAMRFIAEMHKLGIKIPQDISVIGFDNRSSASLCWPPLTTIAQPSIEIGAAAAEILLKKMSGEESPPHGWIVSLPTKLVMRESA